MSYDPDDAEVFTLEYPDAEVVIGIVCAVGADYTKVNEFLVRTLPSFGYRANVLKVSSFISETARSLNLKLRLSASPEARRLENFMDTGNKIRKQTNRCDFFALVTASRLASSRKGAASNEPEPFRRVAHMILSLKRPEEVETLRRIYGTGFFLVGVFATVAERLAFLMNERDVSKDEAVRLIDRDLDDEDKDFGQRTRDTFHRADVFVELQSDRFKKEVKRFLQLVFGYPYTTPTHDEFGMYHAYSASLRSAQLGRQVGASILSTSGDLIAVGCNEVPAAGGGSYWEGQKPDYRDHVRKEDSNDKRKAEIINDIIERLRAGKLLADPKPGQASADAVLRSSLLWDITEFGRAVHAEMDALLSCGRNGVSPKGGVLYTTTFPCHNCTRHIVAAGIQRVVYIEPYAKSHAAPLHEDSIRVETVAKGLSGTAKDLRVPFEPFIGVGPRRFFDLFSMMLSAGYPIDRKTKSGKVHDWNPRRDSKPRIPMALPPTSSVRFWRRERYTQFSDRSEMEIMAKKKSMLPLHGEKYMSFLEASASTSERWPLWIRGERDTSSRVHSTEQHATSRIETSVKMDASGSKRG
ncbi:MAG TPA: anti-phage dCTP deaminase [Bryobacteraceae bacterium]|nr:anti-phage dCTP deaminase [Bryobacteraceae bacterium]